MLTLADELSYPVHFLPVPMEGLALHGLDPRWPQEATLIAFPTEHRIPSQGYKLTLSRIRRLNAEKAAALRIPKPLWRRLQSGQPATVDGRVIEPAEVCGPTRQGLSAVFTGDTAPCGSIEQAAQNADLLIMDATYPDDSNADKAALYGHSTFPQTAALAKAAGVKRLWLTHYSAIIADPTAALPAAQVIFPCAECGTDGKVLRLTFREGSAAEM